MEEKEKRLGAGFQLLSLFSMHKPITSYTLNNYMTVVNIMMTLFTTWAQCGLSTEFHYFYAEAKYKLYINYTTVVNITMIRHTSHLKCMHKQGSHDITMTRHTVEPLLYGHPHGWPLLF